MRKDLFLNLDLTLEPRYTKEFVVKKKDSINLHIFLKNENEPLLVEGQIARLYLRRNDGSVIVQGGTDELGDHSIYAVGNEVIIKLKNSAVAVAGLCYAELELEDEDGILTTQSFLFEVVDRLNDTDTPIKAVQDIYLLAEVEKFIIQAKKDLAEIRQLIDEFRNDVDEAVRIFNERVNQTLQEITAIVNNGKEEISNIKTGIITEIETKKDESIAELETKKTEIVGEVSKIGNQAVKDVKAWGDLYQKNIEIKGNTAVNKVSEKEREALNSVEAKKQEVLEVIATEKGTSIKAIQAEKDKSVIAIENKKNQSVDFMEIAKEEYTSNIINRGNKVLESITNKENKVGELMIAAETLADSLREINTLADTTNIDLRANTENATNILNQIKEKVIEATQKVSDLVSATGEANNIFAELNPLNTQGRLTIDELRDLIRQALDIAMPALRAYIAEYKPSQDLTEVNKMLEELTNAINETYNLLIAHTHDSLYASAKKRGYIGEGVYLHEAPAVSLKQAPPEGFEYKSCMRFRTYESSSTIYYSIFFKEDLTSSDVKGYLCLVGNTLTIKGLEPRVDYHIVRGDAGTSTADSFTLNASTRFYEFNFDFYNEDKSEIVIANPKTSGISDLNKANEVGYYTLDLTVSDFQNLSNAPVVVADKDIKGTLDVKVIGVDTLQTLNLTSLGQVYTRKIGEAWERIDGKVANEVVSTIGVENGETLPEPLRNLPKNPYFWDKSGTYLVIRTNENSYLCIYSYGKPLQVYYQKKDGFYVKNAENEMTRFVCTNGVWTPVNNSASGLPLGNVNVTKEQFKVFACSMPVYTDNTYSEEYCGVTALDFSNTEKITDFKAVNKTGIYTVDIKANDTVLNAPVEGELKGYCDVFVNGREKHLTFHRADGKIFKMVCNEFGSWTDWKEIGADSEIDTSDFVTKDEFDKKLESIPTGSGNSFKGEIGYAKYAPKPEGFAEAVEKLLETKAVNLYPALANLNVTGNIQGNFGRQTGATAYSNLTPGVILIADKNDLDKTCKFTNTPTVIKDKNVNKLGVKISTGSEMSGTNKGYLMYACKYNVNTGEFEKLASLNSSYAFYIFDDFYYSTVDIYNGDLVEFEACEGEIEAKITDFDKAVEQGTYKVSIPADKKLLNSPVGGAINGILTVSKAKEVTNQTLETTDNKTFKRTKKGTWSDWSESVKKADILDFITPLGDKIKTFEYTNADKMPEVYKWVEINGFKIMWIDVKLSEAEYNSGATGMMMKTVNFPLQAQIFNQIIGANINSYNRSGADTLSRVVQNVEIISNASIKGRWRHTDNTPPKIDRFTVVIFGI